VGSYQLLMTLSLPPGIAVPVTVGRGRRTVSVDQQCAFCRRSASSVECGDMWCIISTKTLPWQRGVSSSLLYKLRKKIAGGTAVPGAVRAAHAWRCSGAALLVTGDIFGWRNLNLLLYSQGSALLLPLYGSGLTSSLVFVLHKCTVRY